MSETSDMMERLHQIERRIWRAETEPPVTVEEIEEARREILELFPHMDKEEQARAIGLSTSLTRMSHFTANEHIYDTWVKNYQEKRYFKRSRKKP